MPTAIQLTRANIDRISETLGIDKKHVAKELVEQLTTKDKPARIFYVKDVNWMSTQLPYLIYTEREFLDDFASVPPGIEERFVPVTQIKIEP